ncbi:MAG: RluA family pseudouridine synthase [Rikenellaceae bacterium]
MFSKEDIIYEDNHLIVVNKRSGDLVQSDPNGSSSLEIEIKEFIRVRDNKPGAVYLGVAHRIDRPVSGVVVFAKTSKALIRLNEMIKNRDISKFYWAIVENKPQNSEGQLKHYITRNAKNNTSRASDLPSKDSKEAILNYKLIKSSDRYHLLEIELLTGRHHQIRAQLSKIGCIIKGDLKYGAKRSNPGGGIALHSRRVSLTHPVKKETLEITAPTPKDDKLWDFFAR